MYSVFLKKNEDKRIRAGHSWVYANEVARCEGEGKNGDLASVYDSAGNFLGKGFINHLSKILVRIFIRDEGEADVKAAIKERIKRADEYRQKLGYSGGYRVVFGEADDLPALIIDRYNDLFCIQVLSLGMDKSRDIIVECIKELFEPRGIYERSDAGVREKEGLKMRKGPLYGDFSPREVIRENGVLMTADLERGQKTGYFLDQKENRFAIRKYCRNADSVLDCFCNVGGFSMNAAAAGARSIVALDISEKALSDVRENAELNGFENIETVCGDVFEVLRSFKRQGRQFDTVILDPPAFCKNASEIKDAYRGYKDINILGMKAVKPGGFLATASCSHYMSAALFEKMLREASRDSGRQVRLCEVRTQAPDHPALLAAEETTYLKFYILQVL